MLSKSFTIFLLLFSLNAQAQKIECDLIIDKNIENHLTEKIEKKLIKKGYQLVLNQISPVVPKYGFYKLSANSHLSLDRVKKYIPPRLDDPLYDEHRYYKSYDYYEGHKYYQVDEYTKCTIDLNMEFAPKNGGEFYSLNENRTTVGYRAIQNENSKEKACQSAILRAVKKLPTCEDIHNKVFNI